MTDRVEEHFRLFSEAVRSRDWAAFPATCTPDAVSVAGPATAGRNRHDMG